MGVPPNPAELIMVPTLSLWLPILLSAVLVFVASSVIHMVLKYHRSDYDRLPNEDGVLGALQGFDLPPGDYMLPHCGGGPESLKDPAVVAKFERGPAGLFTVVPKGLPKMGKNLLQWFAFCVLVSVFAAYLAGRALGPGAQYLEVFRFAGAAAFGGYALALIEDSIWYHRKWSTTAKNVFDGLVYALLTAGVFGWLWPAA